jgi:hypothetical protein
MIDTLGPLVLTHPEPTSREADFWPTPAWVTHALLDAYPPSAQSVRFILEPAIGDGAVARVCNERGYQTHLGFDVRLDCAQQTLDCTESFICCDFLRQIEVADAGGRGIITNPPFSLAREFVVACRKLEPDYLALLLPISALAGTQEWRPVWLEHPPTGMLFLLARPKFGGPGNDRLGTFWAVWEKSSPTLAVKWR